MHEKKWDLPGRVPGMTLHLVLCMQSLVQSSEHVSLLSKAAW